MCGVITHVSNKQYPVLIIGCGSYQPIDTYAANTSSKYQIYTDPSLRLHKLFQFKSNLAEGKAGDEQRDYMRNAGSTMSRIFGGIKGALGNLQHVNSVGPKALNGGEVVLSAGKWSDVDWSFRGRTANERHL